MAAAILATGGPVLKTEGNLNNQYGLPLTLLRSDPSTRRRSSSSAVGGGELRALSDIARPDVAVITTWRRSTWSSSSPWTPSPGPRPRSWKAWPREGRRFLNADDPRCGAWGRAVEGAPCGSAGTSPSTSSARAGRGPLRDALHPRVGGRSVDVALPMGGLHVLSNFLAAPAAAHALGIDAAAMAEAATA